MLETRVIDLDDVCFAFLTGHFSIHCRVRFAIGRIAFWIQFLLCWVTENACENDILKVAKFGYRYGDAAYIHESTVCVDEAH